jgi:GTPase SAR1 family protein
MSVMTGFVILVVEQIGILWKKINPHAFGIYGATQVGKTTLHHQLRTRGEVPQIKERTIGRERASRKTIKIDGDIHTIKTSDVGGESLYWGEWLQDMKNRHVKYIIFMIDDRHLAKHIDIEQQLCWKFLVDSIVSPYWDMINKRQKKKRKDYPIAVGIWANKFDLWKDTYPYDDIMKHPIFDIFQDGIQRLNDKGIPTYRYIVSAKSDSEMVYRGITTMIEDY